MNSITQKNANRLALGIIEKYKCSYDKALEILASLQLNLICGQEISKSMPLQAALLTAVNCGKRAFLGGVNIQLAENTPCLLLWPKQLYLNDILKELGASIGCLPENCFSITFGMPAIGEDSVQVVCNSWQGGIVPSGENIKLSENSDLPLGGIAAGALGVATAFFKMSTVDITSGDSPVGISLWNPGAKWNLIDGDGPKIKFLPEKFWLLGLGHLGQAYLWCIGLLPYPRTSKAKILLQDYDRIEEANWSAGVLCDGSNVNEYKTRVCSEWLEDRSFTTTITERKFDSKTKRDGEEPFIALCGFDSAASRTLLNNDDFDLIVEAGLGSKLMTFDDMSIHTFPTSLKTPQELWGDAEPQEEVLNKTVLEKFKDLEDGDCGIIPLSIASKAISSSFVGVFAASIVIAELVRGLNGGEKYDKISVQLRNMDMLFSKPSPRPYLTELSRNGFVELSD